MPQRRKLTDQQVQAIRQRLDEGATQVEVAEEFGITQSHVSNIASGKRRVGRGGGRLGPHVIIDTRYHMTLREAADELGLTQSVLYDHRYKGRRPFPPPYVKMWGVTLYDIRDLRSWYESVPPPGGHRRDDAPDVAHLPSYVDPDGVEHVSQSVIAHRCGVSRQAVTNWAARHDFPKVTYTMGGMKLRRWDEVASWNAERGAGE